MKIYQKLLVSVFLLVGLGTNCSLGSDPDCCNTKCLENSDNKIVRYGPSIVTFASSAADIVFSSLALQSEDDDNKKNMWFWSNTASLITFIGRTCVLYSYAGLYYNAADDPSQTTRDLKKYIGILNSKGIITALAFADVAISMFGCGIGYQTLGEEVSLGATCLVFIGSLWTLYDLKKRKNAIDSYNDA